MDTGNLGKAENLVYFPTNIFKNRSLSVLEVMVEFLVDVRKLRYHEIAVLLNRDDRTIWTVYHRVKQKKK